MGKEGREEKKAARNLSRSTLLENLDQYYGFKVKELRERGEDILFVTPQGPKKLCWVKRKEEQDLTFVLAAAEHLLKRGFYPISRIHPTLANKPFFLWADRVYYVLDWIEGKPVKFRNLTEAKASAKLLGEFHLAAQDFQPPPQCRIQAEWGQWLADWEQKTKDLMLFRDQARQRKDSMGFELLFAKASKLFLEEAQWARDTLRQANYLNLVQSAMEKKHFCHGRWGEDALVLGSKGEIYVTDFSKCRFETVSFDLAYFLKKALSQHGDKKDTARMLLESFAEVYPLSSQETACALAALRWPQGAWKLGDHYFRQRRILPEREWIARLKDVIEEQQALQPLGELLENKE